MSGIVQKTFIPKPSPTPEKMPQAEPEPQDTGPPKIARRKRDEGPLSRMLKSKGDKRPSNQGDIKPSDSISEVASTGIADDQSTIFGDDQSEMMSTLLETPSEAGFDSGMPVTSPPVAFFPKGSGAQSAASPAPVEVSDLSATVEAAAEKGSAKAVSKMEKELKETLNQLSQLRSDHRALRGEAEGLRQGLVATCAENKALRRCLEMRGVIGAKEFEDQYGYAHRHVKGDFSKSYARGGFGREDMKNAVSGRYECKNLGLGSSMSSPNMTEFGTPSPGSSKGKTKQKKMESDPFAFDPYALEEEPPEEEPPPPKREKSRPVKWEVVAKWLKMIFEYRKKHRQDKIKMRPEGDLYKLVANILFPRNFSTEQRATFLSELKMSLQRRELIVDHWDGPSTPLRYAVQRGHLELVKALLRGKADPDESDHKGISLLHFAVFGKKLELAEQLLTWKANPNHPDRLGNSPLFFAPDVDICHSLWEAKASAEILNKRGQSALHLTAQAGLGDVLLWMAAHVSRQILHHHDCNGASALYYARQSHIPPMTIRKIVESKQSNELIKRQADIREKAHLPSALTGHLYMEDFALDDEPGLFGTLDFDEDEQESPKKDFGYGGGLGGFGGYGSYDMEDEEKKQKKKKKQENEQGNKAINETMLALQDLDRRFKVEEELKMARRNMFVQARDMAARIGRETAILNAHKKRVKDTKKSGDDGQDAEDIQEQKTLTPRTARVQMIDLTRLAAAQKSREHARQLREKREQEKKERQQDSSPKYRMEEIHENLTNIPDGSQWRACTVRNMQMELFDVANNAKSAIEASAPATTGKESPSIILTKKRFSTSKVHQPVPVQDLYVANRWKAEQKKLDERMARRMMNDTEAASRIQSAFRRFSTASAEKRDAAIDAERSPEQTKASKSSPEKKRKEKKKEKVEELTAERRESTPQEEMLARDLQKALERLQTETDSVEQSASVMQASLNKDTGGDKDVKMKKEKSSRRSRVPDESSRDRTSNPDADDAKKERRKSRYREGDDDLDKSDKPRKIKKEKSEKRHNRKSRIKEPEEGEVIANQIMREDPHEDAVAAALALRAVGGYSQEHVEKATLIQSHYRGKKAKKEVADAREKMAEELAATRVQSKFRGNRDRNMLRKGKFPGRAAPEPKALPPPAVKQAQDSDMDLDDDKLMMDKMEQAIKAEQEEAAVKIQSIQRGKKARREAEQKKNQIAGR